MADKKSEPKKEAFLVRSLTLTPATEEILKSLSSDATDFTGRAISASAILRALLQYAAEQPYAWLTEKLFPFVESELTSGRTWGKKQQ